MSTRTQSCHRDPSTRRPRVLFVSHDMLWPTIGGGRIHCIALLRDALEIADVDLVVVAPDADVVRDLPCVPDLPGLTTTVVIDQARSEIVPARAAPEATAAIRRSVRPHRGYDVVHIEGHYLWPVIPNELRSRTVVVEQNIESTLLGQRRDLGDPVTEDDVGRLRAGEQSVWRQAPALITLSPDDAQEVSRREPGVGPHLVPLGWDHLAPRSAPHPDPGGTLDSPRLLFFADYDYAPNRDAHSWLLAEVFPQIRDRVPGAQLILGGVNQSPDLLAAAEAVPGVVARGFIADLVGELDRADIVLSPLRWGGGVKVKVVESIRRACLLVSTTAGGTRYIPEDMRSAVCFADGSHAFADHVARLCDNPEERVQRRAQLIANQHLVPTWSAASQQTIRIWSDVARRHARSHDEHLAADQLSRAGA